MFWPILTVLLVLTGIALQAWWFGRLRQVRAESNREVRDLLDAQEQAALELQTQQEALFNSMAEGLLLLDENRRVRIANRSFSQLFEITTDIRSRTLLEALRLHEVVEVLDVLDTQTQVLGRELKLSHPNELLLQVNGSASAPSALDAPATSRQSPDDADGLEAARRAGTFRYRAISNLLTVAFVGVQSPLPRRLRSPVRTATNLRAGLC